MKSDSQRSLSEDPQETTSGCNSITERDGRKQRHNFSNGIRCFYTESEFDSSSVSLLQQAFTPLTVRLLHHLTIYKIDSGDTCANCSKATSISQNTSLAAPSPAPKTPWWPPRAVWHPPPRKDLNVLESGLGWWAGWGGGEGWERGPCS